MISGPGNTNKKTAECTYKEYIRPVIENGTKKIR